MNYHKKASLTMLLILIYMIIIDTILIKFNIPLLGDSGNLVLNDIIYPIITFLVPLIIYLIIKKISLTQVLLLKPISIKNFFIIILLTFSILPLNNLIGEFVALFVKNSALMFNPNNSVKLSFWQIILTSAICPAIFEEIVFRGIFVKEYENCSFWYGTFFIGLFFGIMHLTIDQLFYATFGGIILAILVKVTGSIWSSILCHFVINSTPDFIGIIIENLIPFDENNIDNSIESIESHVNSFSEGLNSILPSIIFFIISIPFLALSIHMFIKENKENINNIKSMEPIKKKNNSKIFNVYFIALILVYLTFMLLISINNPI